MQKDVGTEAIEEKPKWGLGMSQKSCSPLEYCTSLFIILSTSLQTLLFCWWHCIFKGQIWLSNTLCTESHLKASTGFPLVRMNCKPRAKAQPTSQPFRILCTRATRVFSPHVLSRALRTFSQTIPPSGAHALPLTFWGSLIPILVLKKASLTLNAKSGSIFLSFIILHSFPGNTDLSL